MANARRRAFSGAFRWKANGRAMGIYYGYVPGRLKAGGKAIRRAKSCFAAEVMTRRSDRTLRPARGESFTPIKDGARCGTRSRQCGSDADGGANYPDDHADGGRRKRRKAASRTWTELKNQNHGSSILMETMVWIEVEIACCVLRGPDGTPIGCVSGVLEDIHRAQGGAESKIAGPSRRPPKQPMKRRASSCATVSATKSAHRERPHTGNVF